MTNRNNDFYEKLNFMIMNIALKGYTKQIGTLPAYVTTNTIENYAFKYFEDHDEGKDSFYIEKLEDNPCEDTKNDVGEVLYHSIKKNEHLHVLGMMSDTDYMEMMKTVDAYHNEKTA